MNVQFHSELTEFQVDNKAKVENWFKIISYIERKSIKNISITFVSTKRIIEINKEFLQHDYATDIITFDSSFLSSISGEIYLCVDVVRDNALLFSNSSFEKELNRVLVHGLLHLLGYSDFTESQKAVMRKMEDKYLELL